MRIGALQPGYLPWLGFFDQILNTDLFVLYDDMQYNRYSWRNRNYIKGPNGKILLSIPVLHEWGKKINEVSIDNSKNWRTKHLKSIQHSYRSAPFFNKYIVFFNKLFRKNWERLNDLDVEIILYVVEELGIKTRLIQSSEIGLEKNFSGKDPNETDFKTERIITCMKELNADEFYEGAAGKNYINESMLRKESIKLIFQDYKHPLYNQQFGEFIPYLSIFDLLFNHGEESLAILTNEKQIN